MTAFFPSLWHAFAWVLVGSVTDRDWVVFGAAHWFWPLWLLGLGVHEAREAARS